MTMGASGLEIKSRLLSMVFNIVKPLSYMLFSFRIKFWIFHIENVGVLNFWN
jgi:hypothetical protein